MSYFCVLVKLPLFNGKSSSPWSTLFSDTMSLLCCPCLSWANVSRSPGAVCDSNVLYMSPMTFYDVSNTLYISYRSYQWFSWALRLTGTINDFSELSLFSLNYLWLRRATYLCLQWDINVVNALSMSLKSYLFSSKLSVSLVSYLCLQLAFCVPNELSVSPVSYLCLQWATYFSN